MTKTTLLVLAVALLAPSRESVAQPAPAGDNKVQKAPPAIAMKLEKVASGFDRPVFAVLMPGDARGRLLVGEQHTGRIRVLEKGAIRDSAFATIGPVSKANEQGLLGLAFHPQFATNRRLYVNYTDKTSTRIVELEVDASGDALDMASRRELATIAQPYSNHNGGHLVFGPDGKLWAGMGDGGAANDPHRNGQNRKALLGKMIRIDVEAKKPTPEIVHVGVRNPWRFAFDSATGDLFIADVGQNKWEYVFAVPSGATKRNFGWNVVEGNHCLEGTACKRTGFTPPVIDYSHDVGCSITGGLVYRGTAFPALAGHFFYADFCTNIVRSFRWTKDSSSATAPGWAREHYDWGAVLDPKGETLSQISSFGVDARGELLLVSLKGTIWRLAPR